MKISRTGPLLFGVPIALALLWLPRPSSAATPRYSEAQGPNQEQTTGAVPNLESIGPKVLAAKKQLEEEAKNLGLDPKTATLPDIQSFIESKALIMARTELGLLPDAPWKDVFGPEGKEKFRAKAAAELGLPADASWNEVVGGLAEKARSVAAQQLKLDPKASWGDITARLQQDSQKYRDAAKAAGASAAASAKPKLKVLPPLSN